MVEHWCMECGRPSEPHGPYVEAEDSALCARCWRQLERELRPRVRGAALACLIVLGLVMVAVVVHLATTGR